MKSLTPRLAPFLLMWVPLVLAGLGLGAVVEFMRASEALQREGTTLHRIVSQRVEQHDAHLTSLAAVLASSNAESASFRAVVEAMQRFYPRIAAVELIETVSAGGVLLWRTMSDLVESRIGVVDFGFGDAEYKRMYGTESYEDATIRAYGRGVKALGTHAADAGVVTASRLAVRVLARLGTLKKFKRGWRRQLSNPTTGDDAS